MSPARPMNLDVTLIPGLPAGVSRDMVLGPPPVSRDTGFPTPAVSRDTDRVVEVPLESISRNPQQPRKHFDQVAIQALADSIAEHGRVLQPILVRPLDAGGFELVAGERRWLASGVAGMSTVRAIVEGADAATSAWMALAENMVRADLNTMEQARGCAALRDEFGLKVTEIGRRLGRGTSIISHLIRLLDLPDQVQQLIADGELMEGHGRVLLSVKDGQQQKDLAARCAAAGWSVRELERRVKAPAAPAAQDEPKRSDRADAAAAGERLTAAFGAATGHDVEMDVVSRKKMTLTTNWDAWVDIAGRLGIPASVFED